MTRIRKPGPPCTIEGCDLPQRARGWCVKHWGRWQRTGEPEGTYTNGSNICSVPNCGRPSGAYDICLMHNQRIGRNIDTQTKVCGRCGMVGTRQDFGVDRARADGLTPQCRNCRGKTAAAKRRRAEREQHPPGQHYGAPCVTCGTNMRYTNGHCVACTQEAPTTRGAERTNKAAGSATGIQGAKQASKSRTSRSLSRVVLGLRQVRDLPRDGGCGRDARGSHSTAGARRRTFLRQHATSAREMQPQQGS